IRAGKDFAAVATKYSDDKRTKDNGGELPGLVERTDRDLSAQTTDALFPLKKGEVSGVGNPAYALEILHTLGGEGGKIKAAHIVFQFKDIAEYVNDLKEEKGARTYIALPATSSKQP